jgi:hypothetical protein
MSNQPQAHVADERAAALIELSDPVLDAADGPTRMLLLAEYWKREAIKARAASTQGADVAAGHTVVAWRYRLRNSPNDKWSVSNDPAWAGRMGSSFDVRPLGEIVTIAAGAPAETPEPEGPLWKQCRNKIIESGAQAIPKSCPSCGHNKYCANTALPQLPMPAAQPAGATDAVRDVLAERQRQAEQEGWTPAHDDEYSHGTMAQAAACYAYPQLTAVSGLYAWPWASEWWKPRDPRRNYVRAAALLLAEIERLDRAALALANSEKPL